MRINRISFRRPGFAVALAILVLLSPAAPVAPAAAQNSLSASDVKIYRGAFGHARKKRWRQAHAQALKAKDPLPRKILLWQDMSRPGTRMSHRRIVEFIRNNPDWPDQEALMRRAEETMPASMKPAKILAWFEGRKPLTVDGWIMLSRALLTLGRNEDARKAARATWINFTFGPKQQRMFLKTFGRVLTAADHWARLDTLLWDGHHTQARRMWKLAIPEDRALATARMRLRRNQRDIDKAIKQVPKKLINHPGLLYERLRWNRRKGRLLKMVEYLEAAPDDVIRPDLWWPEREYAARELMARGAFARAYAIAQRHGLASGPDYVSAEIFSGWIALRFLNSRRAASAHFERASGAARTPAERARAAYWAGRAATARNEVRAAAGWFAKAAIYDATYYGQLAAARLDRRPRAADRAAEPPTDGARMLEFNRHELTRAVFMLKQLRQRTLVKPFVRRLAALSPDPARQVLAGRLALAIGRPDVGIAVARDAYRTGNPFVVLGYPVINTPGGAIEQGLILSIALNESDFKTRAHSRVGARGLMQIMPRTAHQLSKRLKLKYSRWRLTNDLEYNLIIGRAYLKELLGRYRGSYALTIAAYNSGPGTVQRWLDAFGDPRADAVDGVDWVEMIPYGETRRYVKQVLESLQVYRRRLAKTDPAHSLENDLENMLTR